MYEALIEGVIEMESRDFDAKEDRVATEERLREELTVVGDELVYNNASATDVVCRFGNIEGGKSYGSVKVFCLVRQENDRYVRVPEDDYILREEFDHPLDAATIYNFCMEHMA